MKKLACSVIICIVFTGFFSSIQLAVASFQAKIKAHEVLSIEVKRLNGGTRIFKYNDGYEEVIIDKVVNWINTSSFAEGLTELELNNTPLSKLKITMKSWEVATIEPAYNCISEKQLIDDGACLPLHNALAHIGRQAPFLKKCAVFC